VRQIYVLQSKFTVKLKEVFFVYRQGNTYQPCWPALT